MYSRFFHRPRERGRETRIIDTQIDSIYIYTYAAYELFFPKKIYTQIDSILESELKKVDLMASSEDAHLIDLQVNLFFQ